MTDKFWVFVVTFLTPVRSVMGTGRYPPVIKKNEKKIYSRVWSLPFPDLDLVSLHYGLPHGSLTVGLREILWSTFRSSH